MSAAPKQAKKSFYFYSAPSSHFLSIIFTHVRLDWRWCVWSSPAEGWGSCSEVAKILRMLPHTHTFINACKRTV